MMLSSKTLKSKMKSMFGESTLSYIDQPRENKKSNWKILFTLIMRTKNLGQKTPLSPFFLSRFFLSLNPNIAFMTQIHFLKIPMIKKNSIAYKHFFLFCDNVLFSSMLPKIQMRVSNYEVLMIIAFN